MAKTAWNAKVQDDISVTDLHECHQYLDKAKQILHNLEADQSENNIMDDLVVMEKLLIDCKS